LASDFFEHPPEIDFQQLFASARSRDLLEIRLALGRLPEGKERVLALSPDLAAHLLDRRDLGVPTVIDPALMCYGWELREPPGPCQPYGQE